tara:strand:- start:77 stop:430 length:354 start_codon:yes stop_codon:yes gene_type:complete
VPKQTSYTKGLVAEKMSAMFLRLKGYRVLEARYKTKFGEIDLIVKKGKTIAFVEVKARQDKAKALEAISQKAQKRIMNAALMYIAEHPEYVDFEMRFDVMSVAPGLLPQHHQNMWHN